MSEKLLEEAKGALIESREEKANYIHNGVLDNIAEEGDLTFKSERTMQLLFG